MWSFSSSGLRTIPWLQIHLGICKGSSWTALVLDRGVTRIALRKRPLRFARGAIRLPIRCLLTQAGRLRSAVLRAARPCSDRDRPLDAHALSGSTPPIYMSTNNKNDTLWVSSCYWYSIGESNGAPSPRNRTERRAWPHHLLNVTSNVTRFTPDVLMP